MASSGDNRRGLLAAGGVLSVLAGILQLIIGGGLIACWLLGSVIENFLLSVTIYIPGFWPILKQHILYLLSFGDDVSVGCVIAGGLSVILGITALVGGISAMRRKSFGLSLAGATCALPSGIMGILAVIFIVTGKMAMEFRAKVKEDGI